MLTHVGPPGRLASLSLFGGALVAFSAIRPNSCLIGEGFRDRAKVVGSFKNHGGGFWILYGIIMCRLDGNNEEISQKYIQSQRQAMRSNVSVNVNVNVNVRQSSQM